MFEAANIRKTAFKAPVTLPVTLIEGLEITILIHIIQ